MTHIIFQINFSLPEKQKKKIGRAFPISFGGCLSVWAVIHFFASFSIELNEVGTPIKKPTSLILFVYLKI